MGHARNPQQHHYQQDLALELTALQLVPHQQPATRVDRALSLLRSAMLGPEILGPIKGQYLANLFSVAEQALVALADTVSHWCGGRKTSFSTIQWPLAANSLLLPKADDGVQEDGEAEENLGIFEEDEVAADDSDWEDVSDDEDDETLGRAFDIFLLRHTLTILFGMPAQSSAKVDAAARMFELCSGAATEVKLDGHTIELSSRPELDEEWLAIAFEGATLAVLGLAQCLSARFMGREVKIWGETVAGTGKPDEGMLESWVTLREDEMMRYTSRRHGNSEQT
ncbi:hypothetical protein LTR85_004923 [Meristemomyces frigidus]|nr:hypothetical protein LTR85_004923 [Meristemomyces frigidus]